MNALNKIKTICFITIFTLLMNIAVFGEEEAKNENTFPGIFNFTFTTGGGLDILNSKLSPSYYNFPNGAVNGKLSILGGLTFPVKFYSVKLWAKEEIYIIGLSGDTGIPGTIDLNNQVRNRFYAGLENYFTIDKVMNIGINFESRIQAKASLNSGEVDYIETRLSPVIDLNGSYDFGFSWGISEAFRFYIIPQNDSNNVIQKIQFDGIYYMGFEFMHFTGVKDITGQIYTELDLAIDRFTSSDLYPLNDESNKTRIWWLEYYAGINFNIYGFTPSVGFDMTFDTADTDTYPNGILFAGIKIGLGYTKDIYSFTFTYVGNMSTNWNYLMILYGSKTSVWENHIDVAFSINL
jgi:hypothetical protein